MLLAIAKSVPSDWHRACISKPRAKRGLNSEDLVQHSKRGFLVTEHVSRVTEFGVLNKAFSVHGAVQQDPQENPPHPRYCPVGMGRRDPRDKNPARAAFSTPCIHMIILHLTQASLPVFFLPMAGGDISNGEVYDALEQTRGNIGAAARILGVRRSLVADRVSKVPELVALVDDFRQFTVDTAEDNVRTDVEKGDATASRFVLQTIGKDRGYSTGVAGMGKGGSIVVELKSFDGGTDAERE